MEYIRGGISLHNIFSLYWVSYLAWFEGTIRESVMENVQKLLKCRTPQLGYHLVQCPDCCDVRVIPHSCKSRFCPSCGKVATDKWTEERLSDILSVGYHHLVFTLPWQLRSFCLVNRKVMFHLLFSSVSESLQWWTRECGGYIPGIYIVLHTFGSALQFNPHFHVLITAGGLSLDHKKWIDAPDNFLMPEKGLKKRWRHMVISKIIDVNTQGLLTMPWLPKKKEFLNLRGVVSVIAKLCWYIYMGTRLREAGISVKYIGRYTKKPVIAETRIIHYDSKWVTFRFKDYAEGGVSSVKTMRLFTFITYLTQHIPDKYFRVVRGYGLFSNRLKGKLLPRARLLLGQPAASERPTQESWRERTTRRAGKDPLVCEHCSTPMVFLFVCFNLDEDWLPKLGIEPWEKIPSKQITLRIDTG